MDRAICGSATACRTRSTASSTCRSPTARSACGAVRDPAAEWLQAYALDFLVRARERQMTVPAASLQRGLTWLNRAAERFQPNAQAYAWYVLAKAGLADPGRVRYFQDTQAVKGIEGGLAWSQLAAALNLVGEPGRARLALANAQRTVDQRDPNDYYGSPLRDRAALLALAPEAGPRSGRYGRGLGARAAGRPYRRHNHAGAGLAGARRPGTGRRRRRIRL